MRFVTRAEWGARRPKYAYTALAGSEGIAVHHIGSSARPPSTFDAACATMRSVQTHHMNANGWNDFAYGFGVGAGCVFEGRGWGWIDGADTGVGRLMHSVLWLGDSDVYAPTEADLAAIAWVIAEHARRYPAVGANVVGHGDINATDCPGRHLRNWLRTGRPVVLAATADAPTPAPVPEEDDMKSIVGWDPRDSQWYHVCGNIAVKITPEAADTLKFLGVTDVGDCRVFLDGCAILDHGSQPQG